MLYYIVASITLAGDSYVLLLSSKIVEIVSQ